MDAVPTGLAAATAVTVSAYAARIQRTVRDLGGAVVEGEVQRPRLTAAGALVLDLTDGAARLPCKVLPWTVRGLDHRPREGELVRCRVSGGDFWPRGGTLSVVVDELEPAGDGELLRRRRALVERLSAEGLCDPSRFPPLPRVPDAVAVVASPGSSAWHDVVTALRERWPLATVVDACCAVQGAGAPAAIVDRLARLQGDPRVDVILLARGGGSVQDLVAFDDERLCRAVAALRVPVVCAVGHTDNSPVCNHVTHRAHVPRHAAELATPDRARIVAHLARQDRELEAGARRHRARAVAVAERFEAVAERRRLEQLRGRIDVEGRVLDARAAAFVGEHRAGLAEGRRSLEGAGRGLARTAERVGELGAVLRAADPRPRGWALVRDAAGDPVRDVRAVDVGDGLALDVAGGRLAVAVTARSTDPAAGPVVADRAPDPTTRCRGPRSVATGPGRPAPDAPSTADPDPDPEPTA